MLEYIKDSGQLRLGKFAIRQNGALKQVSIVNKKHRFVLERTFEAVKPFYLLCPRKPYVEAVIEFLLFSNKGLVLTSCNSRDILSVIRDCPVFEGGTWTLKK